MDILMVMVAMAVYLAVLGLGTACAWLMHRRALLRAWKTDRRHAEAAGSISERFHG